MRNPAKSLRTFAVMAIAATALSLPTWAHGQHSRRYGRHHAHSHGFRHRYGYGYGHSYGHGHRYAYGYPYGHGFRYSHDHRYGASARSANDRSGLGAVRIEVEPTRAREDIQVYVDEAHAGVVDDFDGHEERLNLPPGKHEIELRLHGYEPLRRSVFVSPGNTYHFRGRLRPLAGR